LLLAKLLGPSRDERPDGARAIDLDRSRKVSSAGAAVGAVRLRGRLALRVVIPAAAGRNSRNEQDEQRKQDKPRG